MLRIAALVLPLVLPSVASTQLVIRDSFGREIGRVEPSPITPGVATIRGPDGMALGTVEDDGARQRAAERSYRDTLQTIAPRRPDNARDAGRRR